MAASPVSDSKKLITTIIPIAICHDVLLLAMPLHKNPANNQLKLESVVKHATNLVLSIRHNKVKPYLLLKCSAVYTWLFSKT